MFRCLTIAAALAWPISSGLSAGELEIRQIELPAQVSELRKDDEGLLLRAEDGKVFSLSVQGVIAQVGEGAWPRPMATMRPPMVRDGRIARDGQTGLTAWYAGETGQYRHGALGDPVEALALVVQEDDGKPAIYRMTADEVFEDLEPRIVDLDAEPHGRPEIVTITASAEEGAAIAVFGLGRDSSGDPALLRLATSTRIGMPYRWLNIAGIADFDGDGFTEIAYVDRPHIRGELVFLEWRGGRLREQERQGGYANHHGGSTMQDLSEVADIDGDGRPDLLLPDRGYRHFVAIGLDRSGLREIARVAIPSEPVSAVIGNGTASAVYLDAVGRLFELRWAP